MHCVAVELEFREKSPSRRGICRVLWDRLAHHIVPVIRWLQSCWICPLRSPFLKDRHLILNPPILTNADSFVRVSSADIRSYTVVPISLLLIMNAPPLALPKPVKSKMMIRRSGNKHVD